LAFLEIPVGVPQHGILKDQGFSYYYVTVREKQTKTIYTALSSLNGNADLYVKFIDNPSKKNMEEWSKPSLTDYNFKSTCCFQQ